MAYDFNKVRYSNFSSINKKLNKKNTLKIGWVADYTNFNFIDSVTTNALGQDTADTYRYRFNKREFFLCSNHI